MNLIKIILNLISNNNTDNTSNDNINQQTNISLPRITLFSIVKRMVLSIYYIMFTILFIAFHGFSQENNAVYYIGSILLVSIFAIVIIISTKKNTEQLKAKGITSISLYNIALYMLLISMIIFQVILFKSYLS